MHHFAYRDGVLHAEAVNLDTLAAAVGTPFYCYSTATLTRHYQVFAGAFADVRALVCYAMKANSNQAVVKTLAKLGAGADVVSGGELRRARLPAFRRTRSCSRASARRRPSSRSRSTKEFFASTSNLKPELELLSSIASAKGRSASVSIRVNPDIDAKTHHKIATGKAENKFGIPISRAREIYAQGRQVARDSKSPASICISAARLPSSIRSANAFALLAEFVRVLRSDGHTISHVDLGGGLGIPYRDDNEPPPHPEAYAEVVKRATRDLDCRLIFEPGRLLVGNAGILMTRVLFVKHGEAKNFVIVDAAMNDLMRPTLYDAHHEIWPVAEKPSSGRRIRADVVGPVCESGDFLAVNRDMVEPADGALLAVMSAGAYGAVQAGTYNTRALVPEVLVNGAEWALIRPRLEVDQLIALDRMPDWL